MDFRICGDVLEKRLQELAKKQGVPVHQVITDALNHYLYLAEINSKNKLAELLLIKNAFCDDSDAEILRLSLPGDGARLPHLRLVDDGQQRERQREKTTY